jgi:hypothetical protein
MRAHIRDVGGGSGEKWDIPYGAGTCGGGEAAFNLSINWVRLYGQGELRRNIQMPFKYLATDRWRMGQGRIGTI